MTIQVSPATQIENLRNYPAEIVEKLRGLLISGVTAHADARRVNFYDVVEGGRVYFIHVSPVTSKVMLLATWPNQKQEEQPLWAECAA